MGGDLEVSDRRRSFSFVLLEGEGFVDFAPEVLWFGFAGLEHGKIWSSCRSGRCCRGGLLQLWGSRVALTQLPRRWFPDFHRWRARLQGRFLYLKFSNRDDYGSMWLYYSNMQWAQFFRDSSLCSKILIPWLPFFILENAQPWPEVCGPGNFCNSFRAVATQFCQLMSRIIHFILLASWEHPLGHWFSLETPCVPVLNLSQFSIFRVQSNRPTVYAPLKMRLYTNKKKKYTELIFFNFLKSNCIIFSFWFPQEANLLWTFL